MHNNQDLPTHWKILTVLGWSFLALAFLFVLSDPWPWLTQDLPDRSEEIIAITATFGAFIVPLVLTVVQNAFRSAPAFSARLYLFTKYAHSTELAQGFILLALIGLGIAFAPANPVMAVIAKWHLLLVVFATVYLLWFIREAMRFSNHYEQADILMSFFHSKKRIYIATQGPRYTNLLVEAIKEIGLELSDLAISNPRGEYRRKIDLLIELGDILFDQNPPRGRGWVPALHDVNSDILEEAFGPIFDLQDKLLRSNTVHEEAVEHLYGPIFGYHDSFGRLWPKPRIKQGSFVRYLTISFWEKIAAFPLSADADAAPSPVLKTFYNMWLKWLRRYDIYAQGYWRGDLNEFINDLDTTLIMYGLSLEAKNSKAAEYMADVLVGFLIDINLNPEEDERIKQGFGNDPEINPGLVYLCARILAVLYWAQQRTSDAKSAEMLTKAQVMDANVSKYKELPNILTFYNLLEFYIAYASSEKFRNLIRTLTYSFQDVRVSKRFPSYQYVTVNVATVSARTLDSIVNFMLFVYQLYGPEQAPEDITSILTADELSSVATQIRLSINHLEGSSKVSIHSFEDIYGEMEDLALRKANLIQYFRDLLSTLENSHFIPKENP